MATQTPCDNATTTAHRHYADMWSRAKPLLAKGDVTLDSHLGPSRSVTDFRRGLTLIARLSPPTQDAVLAMLQEFPEAYTYPRSDLHVTVLSLVSAASGWVPSEAEIAAYKEGIRAVLESSPPIAVTFCGVSASAAAVVVQGFPRADGLNALRDRLREAVIALGFGDRLDVRYKITTCHSTVARFYQRLPDPAVFVRRLSEHRSTPFGEVTVAQIDLVINDWYMSQQNIQLIESYSLKGVR